MRDPSHAVMENIEKKHNSCYFCGDEGYIFSRYELHDRAIRTEVTIQQQHEGWPGIPHGGIGMTSMLELAHILDPSSIEYPLQTSFRFGGESLSIGDSVDIEVDQQGRKYQGSIIKKTGGHPYLKGLIDPKSPPENRATEQDIMRIIKERVTNSNSLVMPNFSNRIIYNREIQKKYQYRTFEFKELQDKRMYMQYTMDNNSNGKDSSELNRLNDDEVHPGALITILDETLGWAGFFKSWQGGVTTNLHACFLRSVIPGEIIFAIGICDRLYGSFSRKIVHCSGGIFVKKKGLPELVAYAEGKWLTKPEYKQKMLRYLNV